MTVADARAAFELGVELGRALVGRLLLRAAGRITDAQEVAAGFVAGVGHRVAVAGCVCAELDPRMLVEPEDVHARRFAGLQPLEVVEAARFAEIVAGYGDEVGGRG